MHFASLNHVPRDPAQSPYAGDEFETPVGLARVFSVTRQPALSDRGSVAFTVTHKGEDTSHQLSLREFAVAAAPWRPIFIAGYGPAKAPENDENAPVHLKRPSDADLKHLSFSALVVDAFGVPVQLAALADELIELRALQPDD